MPITDSKAPWSLWIAMTLASVTASSVADTQRKFTVSFGTQSISAPVRVSNVHPIVSKMVTLPAVNCGACQGDIRDYTFDVTWVSDDAYLDAERTNLVRRQGGKGENAWVFRPSAYTTGITRNLETLVRHKGTLGNTVCGTVTLSNDYYQCALSDAAGNAVPDTALEVGILVIGPDVMPGDISTLDRALLTRVVTFKKNGDVVETHRDAVNVLGNTTMASCNVNAGSLMFNLPARAITSDTNNSKALSVAHYGVNTTPPSDGVRKALRIACVGNTTLNIQFTPMSPTADQGRILLAKRRDGTDSKVGFQLWFTSREWAGSQYRLVTWDNQPTGLLSQPTLAMPRTASEPDIELNFFASYAIDSTTTLNNTDAGPIMAKGLYTLSYQ